MGAHLIAAGLNARWVDICERVLVQEQGVATREMYADLPTDYFDDAHLAQLHLSPLAVRLELRRLHAVLRKTRGEDSHNIELKVAVEVRDLHVSNGRNLVDAGTGTDVDGTGTLCSDASVATI